MSRVVKFPDRRLEQEQATEWIARLDRGLRGSEQQQLQLWLDENSRHHSTLMETARVWDRTNVLAELAELFPLQEERAASRWRGAAQLAVAASVLVGLGVMLFEFRSRTTPVASAPAAIAAVPSPPESALYAADYTTALGEQRTIELPDHSTIRMNTSTALRVAYTGSARWIEMTRGEANFQVAKDPARIFTVRVAGINFNAVGTAFNIRADASRGVRLTVTEGRVRIDRVQLPTADNNQTNVPTAQRSDVTEVAANSEVVIGQSTESIETLEPGRIVAATAWQRGMIVFDATPLEQVVAELGRYSTTRFVLVDAEIRRLPVSGYFKIGDIDGIAAALHNNFGIDVQKSNHLILLSARSPK
jgi:transmembrane sensor